MRATRRNAIQYLGLWLAAVAVVWSALMAYGRENPWVDRFIIGEIAVCGALAIIFIILYTPKFSIRTIGILSMFTGILILYVAAQMLAAGFWGDIPPAKELPPGTQLPPMVPYWIRSLGRSNLAVAGPCILYGYYYWLRYEAEKEP
jgi:hypothetical protein